MPDFRNRNGRTQQQHIGAAQVVPLGEDGGIPSTRNFYEDVGVDQKGLQAPSLFCLSPLRSSRTYASVSGRSRRPFQIPTNARMASRRLPVPRYFSRNACRTNSETDCPDWLARIWSLFCLSPLRSSRTYASVSGRSRRPFQIPTNARMASRRLPVPRYFSRNACRTNSETDCPDWLARI